MPWIMKQGKKKDARNPKPVVQFDLDGNYIRDWPSARIAYETLGIYSEAGYRSITGACYHHNTGEYSPIMSAALGFRWAYKETI